MQEQVLVVRRAEGCECANVWMGHTGKWFIGWIDADEEEKWPKVCPHGSTVEVYYGRQVQSCLECDGVGAVPPAPGKSRPRLCSYCCGIGGTLEDSEGSDGLKRLAKREGA